MTVVGAELTAYGVIQSRGQSLEQVMKSMPATAKGTKIDHRLIGFDVHYQSKIWRVISAHQNRGQAFPWLTLRRGLIEAVAKSWEVAEVYN
jgi:hypothetical protein